MAPRRANLLRFFLLVMLVMAMLSTTAFSTIPNPSEAVAQGESFKTVQSSNALVSLRIPESWDVIDVVEEEGFLIYGATESARTGRLNDYRGEPALLVGEGGSLTVFDVNEFGLEAIDASVLTGFMDSMMSSLQESGSVTLEEVQPLDFGNGISGLVAVITIGNEQGFISTVGFDKYLVLMSATGTPSSFEANRATLQTIITSVRVPAESGTVATDVGTESQGSDVNLIASADKEVSVILPEGWFTDDQLATNNIIGYSNTQTGVDSRIELELVDDVTKVTISDIGGVIRLFNPADVGIDPANPNIAPLINQIATVFEQNGATVVEQPTEFTGAGGNPGMYFILSAPGVQYGYVVLVAFPEKIVLMSATTTDETTFEANKEDLFSVIQSVSAPAQEQEPSTTGRIPGLGGGSVGIPLPLQFSSPTDNFAIFLPKGWSTYVDQTDDRFAAVLYFGETQEAVDTLFNNANPDEPSGIVFITNPGVFSADTDIDELFDSIAPEEADLSKKLGAEFNGGEARWVSYILAPNTDNAYQAFYVLMKFPNGDFALILAGSSPETFEENTILLEAIFRSATNTVSSGLKTGS